MARKRLVEDSPLPVSSEEEETEEENEENKNGVVKGEDDDDEKELVTPKKKQALKSGPELRSGSDSDTHLDSIQSPTSFTIKPIVSNPPNKSASKRTATVESIVEPSNKKTKKGGGDEYDGKKIILGLATQGQKFWVRKRKKQPVPAVEAEEKTEEGSKAESDENVKTEEISDVLVEHVRLDNYPHLSEWLNTSSVALKGIFSRALEIMGKEKISELEEKFRILRIDELELFVKRLDLTSETVRLVLEAIRS